MVYNTHTNKVSFVSVVNVAKKCLGLLMSLRDLIILLNLDNVFKTVVQEK